MEKKRHLLLNIFELLFLPYWVEVCSFLVAYLSNNGEKPTANYQLKFEFLFAIITFMPFIFIFNYVAAKFSWGELFYLRSFVLSFLPLKSETRAWMILILIPCNHLGMLWRILESIDTWEQELVMMGQLESMNFKSYFLILFLA